VELVVLLKALIFLAVRTKVCAHRRFRQDNSDFATHSMQSSLYRCITNIAVGAKEEWRAAGVARRMFTHRQSGPNSLTSLIKKSLIRFLYQWGSFTLTACCVRSFTY